MERRLRRAHGDDALPRPAESLQLGWQHPTLIVIDYAAQHAQALGPWIEELADRPGSPSRPLRLLLLERNASMRVGWCANVFADGGFGDASKRALLDPPEPVELGSCSPARAAWR